MKSDVDVDAGMLNAMYDLSAGVSDNDDENDGQDDSTGRITTRVEHFDG
jgi:hypothetical protein